MKGRADEPFIPIPVCDQRHNIYPGQNRQQQQKRRGCCNSRKTRTGQEQAKDGLDGNPYNGASRKRGISLLIQKQTASVSRSLSVYYGHLQQFQFRLRNLDMVGPKPEKPGDNRNAATMGLFHHRPGNVGGNNHRRSTSSRRPPEDQLVWPFVSLLRPNRSNLSYGVANLRTNGKNRRRRQMLLHC